MFKNLAFAASTILFSSAAFAQENVATETTTPRIVEPVEAKAIAAPPRQTEQKNDLGFLRLSSVVDTGEIVDPGDLIQINRKFENWNLKCDVRLSKNKRACFVDQGATYESAGVIWRIANNYKNRPISIITLPAEFNLEIGLTMKFSGLEKTLGKEYFNCTEDLCIGGFIFEGFVQEAIINSEIVSFVIPIKNEEQPIQIGLAMVGFENATQAAARDPFGRDITYAVSEKQAKEKEAQEKAQANAAKVESKSPVKKAQSKSQPAPRQNEARTNKVTAPKSAVLY